MSNELMKCPFCGGEAEPLTTNGIRSPWSMVQLDAMGVTVACTECGATVLSYMTEAEAVEAWNTRAERTCHVEKKSDGYGWQCGDCGNFFSPSVPPRNYCPNCGARVEVVGE